MSFPKRVIVIEEQDDDETYYLIPSDPGFDMQENGTIVGIYELVGTGELVKTVGIRELTGEPEEEE